MSTKKKKFSNSDFFVLAIFIGTITFSGYLGWQKYSLNKYEKQLNQTIQKKESAITQFQEYDKIQEKHTAQEIFKKAEEYRINWSLPLVKIFALENKNIEFKSLSISNDQKVSISAISKSYESIALLIEKIKKDPQYNNPFVGNFSESKTDNHKIFNFTITFLYSNKL